MNISFIHPFKIRREPAEKPTHGRTRNLHDKSEGSEFLDDAIHREDVYSINSWQLAIDKQETRDQ